MTATLQMSLFLSYSRRDGDAARALRDELMSQGHETWIDESGIGEAVPWRPEIEHAIETSTAVVLLLSPDFAASEECGVETGRALDMGKRLIPIVVRDTEPTAVPQEVAEINWIFARTAKERDGAAAAIGRALDADPEWDKLHTRVLGRALDWERRGEDRSALLPNKQLDEAEAALTRERPAGQAQVTELQRRYVRASRASAVRRGRRAVAVALGVAVVSIGLAVAAVLQTIEANEQRDTAEERERTALSRSLAAQSVELAPSEPETAALLAVEAARLDRTTEARDALLTVIATDPTAFATLLVGTEDDHNPTELVDPSGRFEISAEGSIVTELATGDEQQLIELDPPQTVVALRDTSFRSDGGRFVFHDLPADEFRVYDVTDGLPGTEARPPIVEGFILDAAYRSDGRLVTLWTGDDPRIDIPEELRLTVFDDDASPLFTAEFDGRIPEGVDMLDAFVIFDTDDDIGAIATIYGEVQFFSPSSARFIGPLIPVECTPDCSDGEIVAAAAALGSVDEDMLATTDHTSRQRTWTLDVDDWIEAACQVADRGFTDEELIRFEPEGLRSDGGACGIAT